MLDMFKRTEICHLCNSEIKLGKKEPLPAACPACGTDLANPDAETIQNNIECEHIKGTLGTGDGTLSITNTRIFWLKDGAAKISVSVALDNIDRFEDCKKMLRKGITLYAKSGESYNFFIPNLGDPQPLKDLLTPYANGY